MSPEYSELTKKFLKKKEEEKPEEKAAESPAEKPAEKPEEKPVEKPKPAPPKEPAKIVHKTKSSGKKTVKHEGKKASKSAPKEEKAKDAKTATGNKAGPAPKAPLSDPGDVENFIKNIEKDASKLDDISKAIKEEGEKQEAEKKVEEAKKSGKPIPGTTKTPEPAAPEGKPEVLKKIDDYEFASGNIPINVTINRVKGEFVPIYEVQISSISRTTEFILEKIRQELITSVNLGLVDLTDEKKTEAVEDKFRQTIEVLIGKYFPDVSVETKNFLVSYLVAKSLGLGTMELLMADALLEEIVVNESTNPIWVYHKKHGWLKTNIQLRDEEQTRHYAAIIGRRVGRQITVLTPLLDAHLNEGDRVNATLMPISTSGNTITLRKFSRDPWTITKFLKFKTMNAEAAALIWLAMEYEMSALIAGGTASGKTSALNVLANFFPPNQRIISIEDTREIRLPRFLHWVPMNTRLPNAEGKGEVSMEHLLINSLRMRPDRILVGEVRRQVEAETLFEAIHTGHSVYATFHANNATEAIDRLTNPPINVPKIVLPAVSLIIVQFRNRRTGNRRTFQIAEILPDATPNVLMQYDLKTDKLKWVGKSKALFANLRLYTGLSDAQIKKDMKEKEHVLNYLVKHEIEEVDDVGLIMAEYYTDRERLMKYVKSNKKLPRS